MLTPGSLIVLVLFRIEIAVRCLCILRWLGAVNRCRALLLLLPVIPPLVRVMI